MSKERLRKFESVFRNHVVGIDIDQVLLSSIGPVIERVRKDVDENFGLDDFKGWDSVKDYAIRKAGWLEKRAEVYENWVWTAPEIIGQARPMPGAQEFSKRLSQFGIEYYAITSRIPGLKETTFLSFERHFPWVDPSQVLINTGKEKFGEHFKYKTVYQKRVTLHLDDSPAHCRLILENTGAACVLISNYPTALDLEHERLAKISANGRLPNLRDFHKKALFEPNFIPSHNVDRQ